MKAILTIISILPIFLLFNESNAIWVNLIGLIYLFSIIGVFSTPRGKKVFKTIYRELNK